MKKPKYYVVWKGRHAGIFDSWEECKAQTNGYEGAKFKSFKTRQLAEQAYKGVAADYIGKVHLKPELSQGQLLLIGKPILESISVDAALDTGSGRLEYQGVDTKTRKLLFHQGPFEDGTINIGEFLAIVHALAYCKTNNITLPIYSDSRNAIIWVEDKDPRTNHTRRESSRKVFELLDQALKWLEGNSYPNPVLKWETKAWGENPADFGRK